MASVRTAMGSLHVLPRGSAMSWLPFLDSLTLREKGLFQSVYRCGSQL